jgi:EmrB/QacA subfamily drug resistance transporter
LADALFSRSKVIALLVAGAFFMENLDGTVVVTALPQMAMSFDVHPIDLNVGVSAYLLTLAILIPASGWVVDRFGARPVFSAAIAVFALASILCGLCQSLGAFTFARILQGAGGAMMVPVGRLTVLRVTEKRDLMRAIATITWPGLAAPVLGPPLGGFITAYASWRWIFLLNAPLGVVALIVALRIMPSRPKEAAKPFDRAGFVVTGAACFALMYGLDLVGRGDASWPIAAASMLGGVAVGALAILHAKRRPQPLVDFRALSVRSYALTIWGGSLFRMAIASVPFLLPLLFQLGFGLNAFQSGMLVLAVFAGNLAMKPFTTPTLRRFSFRSVMIVNGLLNAGVIFACALLTPATPVAIILGLLFVSGLTRSMQFTALITLAFADVPQDWMSGANTLLNIAQQLAMGMGIALGAIALRIAGRFDAAAAGVVPLASFRIAFVIVGAVALLGMIDVLGLHPTAGDEVRRPKPIASRLPQEADTSPA